MSEKTAKTCDVCGALMGDAELHQSWHDAQHPHRRMGNMRRQTEGSSEPSPSD